MNISSALRRIVLLIVLGAGLGTAALSLAQPPVPQDATMTYLPHVRNGRSEPLPGTPTPVPPAPSRSGFFALNDWLTYNAATFVDAQGRTHLAFYTSDEGHQHEPRANPAYYVSCPSGADCRNPANWEGLLARLCRIEKSDI